jgi:hydroxyethylthiazole kinase-like sugar kinase family protein
MHRLRAVAVGYLLALAAGCGALVSIDDYALDGADAGTDAIAADAADERAADGSLADAPRDGGPADAEPVCEASVDTDPAHCGSCDHDCAGRACTAGLCAADTMTSGESRIDELGVSGANLVYLTAPTSNAVKMLPQSTTLASGNLRGVASDGTNVYWIDWGSGELRSCVGTACDGGAVLRGALSAPSTLALDEAKSAIAYAADSKIRSCAAPACGAPVVLVDGVSANHVFMTASHLVFTDATGAAGCARPTCETRPVARYATGGTEVVADAQYAYWVDGAGNLSRCPLSGCAAPTVLRASGALGLQRIAIDATHLYFSSAGEKIVAKCRKPDCAPVTVLARTAPLAPSAIAVDAQYVYWAAGLSAYTVQRTPK